MSVDLYPHEIAYQRVRDAAPQLLAALEAIRDGDVPRPVAKPWRADGKPSKMDQCAHHITMREDCSNCIADFIDATIPTTKHTQGEG